MYFLHVPGMVFRSDLIQIAFPAVLRSFCVQSQGKPAIDQRIQPHAGRYPPFVYSPGLKFTVSPSCRLPFYRQRFSMPDRLSCSQNRTPPGARGKSGMQSIVLSSSQSTPFLLPVSEVSFFILYAIRTAPESFAGCTCPAADRSRPAARRHPGYRVA